MNPVWLGACIIGPALLLGIVAFIYDRLGYRRGTKAAAEDAKTAAWTKNYQKDRDDASGRN